MKEVAAPLNN